MTVFKKKMRLPAVALLAGILVGVINPAVPRGGHHYLAVGQELWRLGASLPPDDVLLDGVQLLEGAGDAVGRPQDLVHVAHGHAVSHQGPFEVDEGILL